MTPRGLPARKPNEMAGPQQKSRGAVAAALGAKSNYPNPKYTPWTTHYKPRTPDARDLDAGRYPILERHWPGFPLPWATPATQAEKAAA